MKPNLRTVLGATVCALVLNFGSTDARAASLYANGAFNGTIQAFNIVTFAVSDSFTLTRDSIITGVNFGVWLDEPGDSLTAINWGIVTTPFTFTAPNTAAVTEGTKTANALGFSVGVDSFSTGSVSLAAGTYFLVLTNGNLSGPIGDAAFWDESNGPSTATISTLESIDSEFFEIIGQTQTATPLPGALSLFVSGLGGLGLLSWRRKKKAATLPA